MPNWDAIRRQVHVLLKQTRDAQPGLTLKAELRGLTLEEATAEAITVLVRREWVAVAAPDPGPVGGDAAGSDCHPGSRAANS
jgi:hypothetical protein